MGLVVATKAFFKLLFDSELSESYQEWVERGRDPQIEVDNKASAQPPTSSKKVETKSFSPKPTRSEALTLLAALQREARLIDILKEPLDAYSDAQIGSAARDVLKSSGAVIDRMFGLIRLTESEDGAQLSTPSDIDPAEYHLIGAVTGSPPFTGTVTHHGWKASRCDVPQWTGKSETALIVTPIELDVS